jgi:hypothetical protein
MEANVPAHFRFAASDLVLQLVIKLRRPNLDALLLLQLLDHPGRNHRLETTAQTGHRQSSSSSS